MILYTYSDGGARGNPGPAGIGVVITDEHGTVVAEDAECVGDMTNNRAEYRAMLKAIGMAKTLKATELLCHGDSELIVYQLQGRYRIKDAQLKLLADQVHQVAASFEKVTWKQVPREHPMISRADKLLNLALDRSGAKAPYKATFGARPQGEFFR